MTVFRYKAKVGPERIEVGVLDAESERIAAGQLIANGWYPVSIQQARTEGKRGRGLKLGALSRITRSDVAVFARQLSSLVGAGVPVAQALGTVAAQTPKASFKELISRVRDRVEHGDPLAASLAAHPKVFPRFFTSLVYAGEQGGLLGDVLERVAVYYETELELRGRVVNALIYPAFLLALGAITIFVLVSFVIPHFVTLFEDIAQDLPLPTRVLISFSRFSARFWWAAVIGVAAISFAAGRLRRTDPGARAFDKLALRTPVAGELILKKEMSRLGRTLSALLENGVPALASLRIVEETLGNRELLEWVRRVRELVADGARLGQAMKQTGQFPPLMVDMVAVGEESGALPGMLSRVAQGYERDAQTAARRLTTLLEPALILVIGSCIGLIVFAILLPIFRMNILLR